MSYSVGQIEPQSRALDSSTALTQWVTLAKYSPHLWPLGPVYAICSSEAMILMVSSSSDLPTLILFLFFYWVICLLLIDL